MTQLTHLLGSLPSGLRTPLIKEYKSLVQSYMESRWGAAELSAGKICEIVYSIIKGAADGSYPDVPSKPRNMSEACKKLESCTSLPRSFQILIPRLLPALYEIRNNRGVGHVGGDVDPNSVDAHLTISIVDWLMAELVRVYHTNSLEEAQKAVNSLSERRIPLVWVDGSRKKILNNSMSIKDQILVLVASTNASVGLGDLMSWTESKNRTYLKKLVMELHKKKLIHFDVTLNSVTLLPTGANSASKLIEKYGANIE